MLSYAFLCGQILVCSEMRFKSMVRRHQSNQIAPPFQGEEVCAILPTHLSTISMSITRTERCIGGVRETPSKRFGHTLLCLVLCRTHAASVPDMRNQCGGHAQQGTRHCVGHTCVSATGTSRAETTPRRRRVDGRISLYRTQSMNL